MGMTRATRSLFFGLVLASLGCAQGHCRRQVEAPEAAQPLSSKDLPAHSGAVSPDHVFVYKYDGSLQCGMGKAMSVEVMGKDLQGIPVVTSLKKSDGLMHIQVCGSITGMANVYEIPAKFEKQAENKGFKKWSFE